jgi:CelD/BcsL family acetyltransferase involved in cellulose biosynthesis
VRLAHAREIDSAEWNALVAQDPTATFFARAEWVKLLGGASAEASPFFLLAYEGDRLAAGLPAVRTRRCGFSIIESLPHGTYGGIVSASWAPPEAAPALLGRYARIARGLRVAAAHLMDLRGVGCGLERFRARDEGAQILRLDRPFDEIWSGFKPSARNKIRKARKAGVTVRRASSEADFRAYHSMLEGLSADWGGTGAFGIDFFVALSKLPSENVQMWLAELDGEIIGADLNLVENGWIMNWGNVSRREARRHAPNNLLHAVAIERGIEDGHRVYDLGSSAGIRGVDTFKAAFGTERIPLRLLSAEKLWYRLARRAARRVRGGR